MRILFVTEQFPYPLDTGGNVRTFNLLRGLAQEHEITLIATSRGEVIEAHRHEVGKLCRRIRIARAAPASILREGLTFARSLVSRVPFLLSRHAVQAVRREIASAFQERSIGSTGGAAHRKSLAFDVVHFNHLDAALYAADMPTGLIRVLDEQNVVTNQVKTTLAAETRLAMRLLLRHEYAKLRVHEARICNRMHLCLVCSDTDAQALRQLGVRSQTTVIPNGVDLEYFAPISWESVSRRDIVFVGTLDYDPCEKGVWYFCTEILPLIRRAIPTVRFVVVGRNPSSRLRVIADLDPGVILTGRVEDIRPYVQKAGVFVVPLLSGSGTRLKILESMAAGVPVVSTSIGVEGIEANNDEELLIADAPKEFAAAVVKVLHHPEDARLMSERARRLVEAKYGWRVINRALLTEYRSLGVA